MLSLHTSPLHQPGTGDAGGMNVYVVELSRRLAERGIEVEVFTRATAADQPPVVQMSPGVTVRHVEAGPYGGVPKDELPAQMCPFAREVLRTEAAETPGYYDVVHAHYWLSGQVGALARDRWGVPLVQSMHTLAKVKNDGLADGDRPEPDTRLVGEQQVVDAADVLVANTDHEARDLVRHYGADPERVRVVHPGVDLDLFRPLPHDQVRPALGLPPDAAVVLFAGRLQPLKAPDVLLHAIAHLVERDPELGAPGRLVVPVIGGPSGSGLDKPEALIQLARRLGISDQVRFLPPVPQAELAGWYAASSVVCVPSYNESFGLVAVEAQACGTPVLAAAVGGLTTAIEDGGGGVLLDGHDPAQWADTLHRLLRDEPERRRMGDAARQHALGFGWGDTARRTAEVYDDAVAALWAERVRTAETPA